MLIGSIDKKNKERETHIFIQPFSYGIFSGKILKGIEAYQLLLSTIRSQF